MGIFRFIIALSRRLRGIPRDPVASLDPPASGPSAAARDHGGDDDDDDDDDDGLGLDDATRDGQHSVQDEWDDMQSLIARCDAEGIDIAGLDIDDPTSFWTRQMRIEEHRRQGKGRLHSVVLVGFRSLEHWDQVSRYYQARWSQLVERDTGELEIRPRQEFTDAALHARTPRSAPR